MTIQAVTASTVDRRVLEPAMNATALQMQMSRLIDRRDTPQVDSLVECLAVMKGAMQMAEELIESVAAANGLQLPELHSVTGWADTVVTALRDHEKNAPAEQRPPSARKLAHRVIGLMAVIADDDPFDAAIALADLFAVFDQVAPDLLFGDTVAYHVGVRRLERLRDLHARYTARLQPDREAVAA